MNTLRFCCCCRRQRQAGARVRATQVISCRDKKAADCEELYQAHPCCCKSLWHGASLCQIQPTLWPKPWTPLSISKHHLNFLSLCEGIIPHYPARLTQVLRNYNEIKKPSTKQQLQHGCWMRLLTGGGALGSRVTTGLFSMN